MDFLTTECPGVARNGLDNAHLKEVPDLSAYLDEEEDEPEEQYSDSDNENDDSEDGEDDGGWYNNHSH